MAIMVLTILTILTIFNHCFFFYLFQFPHKQFYFRLHLVRVLNERQGFFQDPPRSYFGELDVERFVFHIIQALRQAETVVLEFTGNIVLSGQGVMNGENCGKRFHDFRRNFTGGIFSVMIDHPVDECE